MTHTATLPSVVIIGAGFGGLGLAVHLRRAGVTELTVLEKADDVGGVWRDNTYPGAACDVPSSLYSWSFAPNPDWPRRYAEQPDILAYLRREADRLGVREHVRTGAEVVAAGWDELRCRWTVELADGERLETDVLVSAVGQLSRPSIPDLPGLGDFAGPVFHSAQWDHGADLTGARVAVVGTGASAIQFVPAIVDRVESLTVFQRSAPYVVPKPDRGYSRLHTLAFRRLPGAQAVGRRLTFWISERLNAGLSSDGGATRLVRAVWRAHLHVTVRDRELRGKLVPDHPIGCKRLLFSNTWYPALVRPHVKVETAGIAEVERDGVRTTDGVRHRADVVILGTGFAATDFLAPMEIRGRSGAVLHESWDQGARAYLGMTVPDFPNFFILYGPNTNLGGSSIVEMLEAQARHVTQAVTHLGSSPGSLSLRTQVLEAFDRETQGRLAHSVWSGCRSWYREAGGRVSTNWPGLVAEYRDRTARFRADDYEVVMPSNRVSGPASGGRDDVDDAAAGGRRGGAVQEHEAVGASRPQAAD